MGTFSGLLRNDSAALGEFRTKRLILEVPDAMQTAIETGTRYRSPAQRSGATL